VTVDVDDAEKIVLHFEKSAPASPAPAKEPVA
jgi:hypothetical protein